MQTLMARLKAKRFRQIFTYLDQNQAGVIDLLDLATGGLLSHDLLLLLACCIRFTHCFINHEPWMKPLYTIKEIIAKHA